MLGNAAVLGRRLGITLRGPFGVWHDQSIGVWGELEVDRDQLGDRLAEVLGAAPKRMLFGPTAVHRVGVATGAAASLMG